MCFQNKSSVYFIYNQTKFTMKLTYYLILIENEEKLNSVISFSIIVEFSNIVKSIRDRGYNNEQTAILNIC